MKILITIIAILTSLGFYAQNNVGIGTLTPNAKAILEIKSNNKGILITRLTSVARNTLGTALTNTEDGMLVYDKDLTAFYYWDGPNLQWVQVGSGAGDNWGGDVVNVSGTNISGDGTTANPLIVTDGDTDSTNEIELPPTATTGQVLSWNGTSWVAQNSASGADNWGSQTVVTTGANISGDGTTGSPITVTDGDSDATNEIELPTGGTNGQVLSTDGSGTYTWISDNGGTDDQNIANLAFDNTTNILTVGIENGNSQTIDLSSLVNDADNSITNEIQDLSINTITNILTITNNGSATSIDLSSYLDNTDNQDLSLTGNTLSLTNDGTTVDLSGYMDNTDTQNITGSGLLGTILTIGIQNGTNETVDLSSLTDADWYKVGTTTAPTNINDNIFTQGNVGIGMSSPPSGKMEISSQTSNSGIGSFIATSIPQITFRDNGGGDYSYITGFDKGLLLGDNLSNYQQAISGNVAPSPALYIAEHGKVGINTFTPTEKLEVQGSVKIVDGTQGVGKILTSDANGKASWQNGVSQALYTGTWDNSYASANFTSVVDEFTGLSINLLGGKKYLVFVRAGIVIPGNVKAWKYIGYGINSTTTVNVSNFLGGQTSNPSSTIGFNYVDDTSFIIDLTGYSGLQTINFFQRNSGGYTGVKVGCCGDQFNAFAFSIIP